MVIIDDHPEYLDYLATLLDRAGYRVAAFTNAAAALRSSAMTSAGLIVTDVFMPDMDGVEVLKRVQQQHPALPLIAVSGVPEGDTFLRWMQHLGAHAIFTKPIDAEELLRTIAALLGTPGERHG